MKKIYLTLFLAAFLIFSNALAVSSLTNSQKNQVAQSFYNTGATFMRGEEFLKAKDFFIYSCNEAVKVGNNYLAYASNERIKDCNNMLGLELNDYTLSRNLTSKQIILPSSIYDSPNIKKTMTVSQYKKFDSIKMEVFKNQNLEFKYQVISGDVSIYFIDKDSYDAFLRANWFLPFSSEGITGIQLPSNTGPLVNTSYNVPHPGYWYFIVVTESAEKGEVEIEIL